MSFQSFIIVFPPLPVDSESSLRHTHSDPNESQAREEKFDFDFKKKFY
jgi:hypothetical protein